jgi:hypothetical protein
MAAGFYGHLVASLGVSGVRLGAKVAGGTLILFIAGVVPAVRLGGLEGLFALYAAIYFSVALFYDHSLRRLAGHPSAMPAASR